MGSTFAHKLARFRSSTASFRIAMLHLLWRRLVTRMYYGALFRKIGRHSVIFKAGMLVNSEYMTLGDDVSIRYGGRLEVVLHGQDWEPSLQIGNNVNIEQCVHIVCHDNIVIEDNVSIAPFCIILDTSFDLAAGVEGRKIGAALKSERSSVRIGENSLVGAGVTILPNVFIGKNCVIGAGSVVTYDIPEASVAVGAPARVVRRLGALVGTPSNDR
jgi:acetyltransferase-like isoleucine patch superfamily enzyme